MKEKTFPFPVMVNSTLSRELPNAARDFVEKYKKTAYPILYKFGLLDDEHIARYFPSVSVEDIYRDALKENPQALFNLEQEQRYNEEPDVWKQIRDGMCFNKDPQGEGFVFRKMPYPNYVHKDILLKALSVKDGVILIDNDRLLEAAIVHPTNSAVELWEMLCDFCKRFNEKGFAKKKNIKNLFLFTKDGIKPNVYEILGRIWIEEEKGG